MIIVLIMLTQSVLPQGESLNSVYPKTFRVMAAPKASIVKKIRKPAHLVYPASYLFTSLMLAI
jgi:hypothetical protein